MSDGSDPASSLRAVPPHAQLEPRVAAQAAVDLRVSMVLSVLGGRTAADVAQEWDIESSLVHRWVRDFLVAGTTAITNRPDPDAARQRDRFLAAFAHEVRTPVAIAHGWAMELAEGEVPPEQVQDAAVRLSEALTRLSEHIDDVDLSTAASLGLVRVAVEPVDVEALCRTLPGSPAVRHGADVAVCADARLLGRVLRDLWTTARRDPVPPSVAIDVVEAGSWHEVRVTREGAPIDADVVRALMDPFDHNNDATGVTMGLYVARALTVAQGGFLGAEGDEQRTVLLVRLPRRDASEPVPPGHGSKDEGETP